MRWKKLGLLFCPPGTSDWMTSHAAVPIAERLGAGVFRVHFSSRDNSNRSRPGWVDVALDGPARVLRVSEQPLMGLGDLGCFDESGVMPNWLVNRGTRRYLYYQGWNTARTVPFRNAVGLAISEDVGRPFERFSRGPILDRGPHDPCFVATACVLPEGNLWHMWYLSCIRWTATTGKPTHHYHIKYARSADGIAWERAGRVCIDFRTPAEYAISRPSVLKDRDRFKMWYSWRGDRYRIGYAESEDGIRWERMDQDGGLDVSASGWDSEMVEYPFVFEDAGQRYMLYNGNAYGRTGFGLAVLESA